MGPHACGTQCPAGQVQVVNLAPCDELYVGMLICLPPAPRVAMSDVLERVRWQARRALCGIIAWKSAEALCYTFETF